VRFVRIPSLLREREFRSLWVAQTISMFGDQVTFVALPLTAVLVLDAGPAQMGYLGAAELSPYLLFSLFAGAWVDRRGRRRQTMIAADLGRAAVLASVPIAYTLDVLSIAQLYGVGFAVGTLSVFFAVAYTSLFVSVVDRPRYVEGNSLIHGSRAFSFVAGPSVGGALVQLVGAARALAVDAASYLVSAFFLAHISPIEPPTETQARGHVVAGLRFIWREPILRSSLASTATINFFNFVFHALMILYVTRELGVRPATLGLVLGAGAVGGVIGSVVTGRLIRRLGVGPTFVLGSFLFPAPLVLIPLAGGPYPLVLALLFLAEFGAGLGVMMLDIAAGSIFQAIVPDRLRARFSGSYMLVNYGVRPIGSLTGGALGSAIGLRPTLWLATTAAVAGALWLLPSPLVRMRELPDAAS
jgi:MFS family permease